MRIHYNTYSHTRINRIKHGNCSIYPTLQHISLDKDKLTVGCTAATLQRISSHEYKRAMKLHILKAGHYNTYPRMRINTYPGYDAVNTQITTHIITRG